MVDHLQIHPFEISIAGAIILLLLELLHGFSVFIYLSFAASLMIVAGVEYFSHRFSAMRDTFIFASFSICAFICLRVVFSNKHDVKRSEKDINTY
jgi:predicted membrane metal-binding protein